MAIVKYWALLVFVACSFLATGVSNAAPRFLARTWQSEDGLPSNTVRAIAQAADGYLWVGTAEGVVRFDGVRFTGFPAEPDATLSRMPVRALFPLANGEVWVPAGRGALLCGRGGRVDEVRFPMYGGNGAVHEVNQVVLGENGDVFALRGTEIWQIVDGRTPRVVEKTPALEKLLQEDAQRGREHGRPKAGADPLRLRDSRGRLWQFAPEAGLTIASEGIQPQSVSLEGERPAVVRAMLEDREGNIWLATSTQGLWRLRASRVDVLATADGLSDRGTLLVLEDRAGALWLATAAGGLDRLSEGTVKHFDVPPSTPRRPVGAMCEAQSGELWVGRRDGQVYCLKDEAVRPMFEGQQGASKVAAIAEDGERRVWLGGRNGLFVAIGNELRPSDLPPREKVTALLSTGATMWAGTESGQLFRGSIDHFELAAGADAFAKRPISSLLADADRSLWIATQGGGLFHLQGDRVRHITLPKGSVDPRLTCVLDDHAGFLWLGTLGGICRLAKSELNSEVSASNARPLVLDRSDGLLTRECTWGGQPAGWRARDGTLWFSTANGLARVTPDRLTLNAVPPPVVIEEISANGHALPPPFEQALRTGPGRSRLEFRYTALSYTAPEKVRFRTRLEGLEDTWHENGPQRTIAYQAVPPGRYYFRVVAENGDGLWNETGAAVMIDVLPHFWETRWFQGSVALAAAALAFGVGALITRARMRGRLLRLEAQTSRDKERARIARDLHDQVGANLTQISLLAEFADTPEGLNELTETTREAAEALDSVVWAVDPRKDTLENLLQYIVRVAEDFLRRARIRTRIAFPKDVPPHGLSPEFRHHILLIVKEALNNAAKYASPEEVELSATLDPGTLTLSIYDNGRGFDPASHPDGNGLQNMRDRVASLGGVCKIESSPGAGTRVSLRVPWPQTTGRFKQ